MGCLVELTSRLALLALWLATPWVNRAFSGGWILPLLGIIFLPITALELRDRLRALWRRQRLGMAVGRPGVLHRPILTWVERLGQPAAHLAHAVIAI